jgi:hypothetical protein
MQVSQLTVWLRRVTLGLGIAVLIAASPVYAVTTLDSVAVSPADGLSPAEFFKKVDQESELVSETVASKLWDVALEALKHHGYRGMYWWNVRHETFQAVKDRLAKNGRVRFIRTEVAAELCRRSFPNGDCEWMQGFYMPFNDKIYLVGTSAEALESQPSVPPTFFHEVIHAYQYSVRYGYDLQYLRQLAVLKKAEISPEDLLAFFYEAQAHWYTIKTFKVEQWQEVHASSGFGSAMGSQLVNHGKSAVTVFTLGLSTNAAREFVPYLPQVDVWDKFAAYLRPYKETAYDFNEPILFRAGNKFFNVASSVDFKFHRTFSNSVEKSYYGGLGYRAGKEGKWLQAIFRNLNDMAYGLESASPSPYWQAVMGSGLTEYQVMETQNIVPYTHWREQIQKSEFQPFLNKAVMQHITKKRRKLKKAPKGLKISQFWLRGGDEGQGGSEGSHGDLLIHPQFPLSPENGE